MSRASFTLVLSMFTLVVCAQSAPEIEWQRNLGGSMTDIGASIKQTSDGGFIVCGFTSSNNGDVSGNHGLEDIWVVKLDATGIMQWQRCLGGSQGENGKRVLELSDGGYLVLGSTRSNDGDVSGNHGALDLWLARLNETGILVWQRCYGGSLNDVPNDIKATPDGGYIIVGESRSSDGDLTMNAGSTDYWVLKLDANYDIQWQRSYGGSGGEVAVSIALSLDGGYLINGTTSSNNGDVSGALGLDDYWIIKLDASGNLEWQRPSGGGDSELAQSIAILNDGSLMALGGSRSQNGDVSSPMGSNDVWAVTLSPLGVIIEDRSYGGSDSETGTDMLETSNGSLVYCGSTRSNDGDVPNNQGNVDAWIFRTDAAGSISWNVTLGGSQSDSFSKLLTTNDGGYIAIGSSNSTDGDLPGNQGGTDIWVVKFGADPLSVNELRPTSAVSLYPNPCSDKLHLVGTFPGAPQLRWFIIDAQGKPVDSGTTIANAPITVERLAPGAYTLLLENGTQRSAAPFVKQ